MATLNPNIILSGSNPNLMGSVAQGMQMRAFRDEMQQRNALADMYQQHGQSLVSGDPGSINALAAVDPRAAMDFQTAHTQNQRAGAADSRAAEMHDARLQEMRETSARAAREDAARLSEAERTAAAEKLESGLRGAATFAARGDQAGLDEYMRGLGMDPIPLADFPAVAASVLGNLDALNDAKEFYGGGKQSEAEQKIQRVMQDQGVDRRVAQGVVDGLLRVSRDPVDDTIIITNLATGEVSAPQMPEQPGSVAPTTAQPTPEASPVDGRQAFGAESVIKNTINTVSDAAGAGAVFPEAQEAQATFRVLQEGLLAEIQSGYTRQPPSWLLKEIRELTPKSGSIWEGPDKAVSKLNALQTSLANELRAKTQLIGRKMSPKGREALDAEIDTLNSALERIRYAKQSLGAGGGEAKKTSSGVTWEVVE